MLWLASLRVEVEQLVKAHKNVKLQVISPYNLLERQPDKLLVQLWLQAGCQTGCDYWPLQMTLTVS